MKEWPNLRMWVVRVWLWVIFMGDLWDRAKRQWRR